MPVREAVAVPVQKPNGSAHSRSGSRPVGLALEEAVMEPSGDPERSVAGESSSPDTVYVHLFRTKTPANEIHSEVVFSASNSWSDCFLLRVSNGDGRPNSPCRNRLGLYLLRYGVQDYQKACIVELDWRYITDVLRAVKYCASRD